MIRIVQNQFEGLYASPMYHPVTCANPSPWQITEMKFMIEDGESQIWVRGEKTFWFRLEQCNIGQLNWLNHLEEMRQRTLQEEKKRREKLIEDMRRTFNLCPREE